MSQQRIANAVEGLIAHLVPADPSNSERTQERHEHCFQLVNNILNNQTSPPISSDVNHASDLIKRKLIQTNPTQALRFANLYTRLLSLPVLDKKWAILHLLYQLSDSPDPSEPLPLSSLQRRPAPPPKEKDIAHKPPERDQASSSSASASLSRGSEEELNDAFQPAGLKKFPPDKARRGPAEEARVAAATAAGEDMDVDPTPARDVSLKTTLLAENSLEINPSEPVLLRDLPFTLQGLSSTTLPFSSKSSLKLPPTLPAPIISLLHQLAEPSLLYRRLDSFVKSPANGLLGQSLRSAMTGELRSYLGLVATLEAQIRRALAALDESAPRHGIGKAGVTLKRLVVWTREATMGLRLLSLIAEESRKHHGGRLISLIHGFLTSHGDPTVGAFAERLLTHVTRPFYDMLRHWIYDGELSDPYLEFFVREQDPMAEKHKEAKVKGLSSLWNDKYEVDESMVPGIISADFAQKVFLIGKSLNFIRHSCGDSQWVEEYSKAASKELRYGDTATLEAWIDEAYKTTMKRLMHLMTTKFHLFEHLQAMKDYILLGQGDFIALLMESLAPNLDRPAGAQYRHTLTAKLEEAIRGSNAQYASPEVLRRLDARMLQLSQGDIGWDLFTLEYKIDAPVDCILTEWHGRQYLKMFNFLWRVKRVEFALHSVWRKSTTGSRGVLQTKDPAVAQTWRTTRGTLAEMVHWAGQLQYYILFEVIEASWGQLQKALKKEDATLDDLIDAHTTYLDTITQKGLLGAKRKTATSAPADAGAADEERSVPMNQIADILRNILSYRDSVDGLYSWAVSDFTSRQNDAITAAAAHEDTEMGGTAASGNNPLGFASAAASEFPALQERLRVLGADFRKRVQRLLGDLAYTSEHETRFLGLAMNFNDVYQPMLRARHKPGGSGRAAAAAAASAVSTTGSVRGERAAE
ncbi:uncharacterized protein PgNI_03675 [Pyricularia grisea]|uniref:Uncharacterized protein n=1 Tax=Pyricularia grisea TaxID=148305 RepID=A0A6P8BBU9_PYRGI|nr:uncharacterized protein PgNI_03675 [Pyricularia grisea]TLD13326.1 hypothetical protein PgNI_03675 [Pyricularia grisea]